MNKRISKMMHQETKRTGRPVRFLYAVFSNTVKALCTIPEKYGILLYIQGNTAQRFAVLPQEKLRDSFP